MLQLQANGKCIVFAFSLNNGLQSTDPCSIYLLLLSEHAKKNKKIANIYKLLQLL